MSLYDYMIQNPHGILLIVFFFLIAAAAFLLPVCDACMERRENIKTFFKSLFEKK